MTAAAAQRSETSSSSEPGGQSTELPSRRHNKLQIVEQTGQKRHLRERQFTNYNEDYIQFDSLELDERPYKRSKEEHVVTIPSIAASHLELETAWAVVVNAGESILDEEEDLLPAGAHEQVYVQVCILSFGPASPLAPLTGRQAVHCTVKIFSNPLSLPATGAQYSCCQMARRRLQVSCMIPPTKACLQPDCLA